MVSCSTSLADWLNDILAEDNHSDLGDHAAGALSVDDGNGVGPRVIWHFSAPEVRDEYLSMIDSRPEDEVRKVIERILIPSVALGSDYLLFETWLDLLPRRSSLDENESNHLAVLQKSDHVKRIICWFFGTSKEPPWQGLKWVLDLLPFRPRLALDVIQAYVVAHAPCLSDAMYDALHDAQAIIRARYIGVPKSTAERVRLLQELSFREFEQVVEQLYSQMGYKTQLTPSSMDDGRDIIATSSVAGRREHVLIECKRYQGKVRIETVRALQGIVGAELANKGALVTTAQFTRGARKLEADDRRIELISGPQLVLLLNEHLGHTWPVNIEWLARERPIAVRLRENGQN